jgi:putative oxidoreductase
MSKWSPVLLSVLRIASGLSFVQHGTSKLLNFPPAAEHHGGASPGGIMANLVQASGPIELIGGALVLFGLFTRPAAFILSGEMAVAYFTVHAKNGLWLYPMNNNGEAAVLYCFIFLYLAAAGGGPVSIDKMRGKA